MIVGIGVDVIHIQRIELLFYKYSYVFVRKILHINEIHEFTTIAASLHTAFLAKRFAAKESISKAIGLGIWQGLNFSDIYISHDIFGKPIASINMKCFDHLKINLSITDDYPIIIAFTIIEER